jgi:hypothetical protein
MSPPKSFQGSPTAIHMQDLLEEQPSWVEQSTPSQPPSLTEFFHCFVQTSHVHHRLGKHGFQLLRTQNPPWPFHSSSSRASWPLQTKTSGGIHSNVSPARIAHYDLYHIRDGHQSARILKLPTSRLTIFCCSCLDYGCLQLDQTRGSRVAMYYTSLECETTDLTLSFVCCSSLLITTHDNVRA